MPLPPPAIKIEKGFPIPKGHFSPPSKYDELKKALKTMRPGESFVWSEDKKIYWVARKCDVTIKTRKLGPEGYRVWLVERKYRKSVRGAKKKT